MSTQGNVLTQKQYSGAPIERAHLHRGFKSKKTPLKWIRFFRACALQYQHANAKKAEVIEKIWYAIGIIISITVLICIYTDSYRTLFTVSLISVITGVIMTVETNTKFKKKYTDGFDFFSYYFSAFFTLIEEDLQPQSTIRLEANVKNTIDNDHLLKQEKYEGTTRGFLSGKNLFYQKEISKGSCFFNDGAIVSFNFTERVRNRVIKKRSASGKLKMKQKYKSVYRFTLKMKLPKEKYMLKPQIDTEVAQVVEDGDFYGIKTVRKFDVQNERPEEYDPRGSSLIRVFSSDYFALELINLINVNYSCVTPRV